MKYLVLDIGGSAIKYALMTHKLDFIEKGKELTPLDNIQNFIKIIGKIYDKYKNKIAGIAISMPGILDIEKGYAYTGGALEYNSRKKIVKILQKRCPTKITIENDGKCAALAEVWKGNLKSCNNAIVIVLGTAIGGGIIIDKKVYKGKNFFAGEFSSINTNVNDPGNFKSSWAYINGSRALIRAAAKVKNVRPEELDGYKVFEYANSGDKAILKILDDFTYKLVVQIYNLQCIFNPDAFAIGGGISSQDILMKYINKNLDKYHTIFNFHFPKPKVVRCKFKNDANLVGALYNFLIHN